MIVCKEGNSVPLHSTEIWIIVARVFYNRIIPTGIVLLENIHSLFYHDRQITVHCSHHIRKHIRYIISTHNVVELAKDWNYRDYRSHSTALREHLCFVKLGWARLCGTESLLAHLESMSGSAPPYFLHTFVIGSNPRTSSPRRHLPLLLPHIAYARMAKSTPIFQRY